MKKFYDEIYEVNFYVFYNEKIDVKKLKGISNKDKDFIAQEDKEFVEGKVLRVNAHTIVVILKQFPIAASTLCHEVFHACRDVFEARGIPITSDTNECFAYYMGYVADKILSVVKKV